LFLWVLVRIPRILGLRFKLVQTPLESPLAALLTPITVVHAIRVDLYMIIEAIYSVRIQYLLAIEQRGACLRVASRYALLIAQVRDLRGISSRLILGKIAAHGYSEVE
jgi:hypothetical protein